ncbi:Oviduct-specific glycoprotein [Mactra antiquata]
MGWKVYIVCLVTTCFVLSMVDAAGYKRVCYYSNWSQYRNGAGRFMPKDIDPSLCTHLIYSFAKLTSNYELTTFEWNDIQLYKDFNGLKKSNPNLKTLLAVGGWNAGSTPFSNMVTDQYYRKKFARQSVEFIVQYGFDGLDMDWEYPANRGGRVSDKENFIVLLSDIREAMRNAGQSHLLLTAAVSAGDKTIESAYDIEAMAEYLDFINLMSYDLHGAWESFTGHNSPLYSRSSEYGEQALLNVDWAAKRWNLGGTPKEKLIIGLATYGRHFKLTDPFNHGMNAPTSGPGTQGPFTAEQGFLAYYEVCQMLATGGTSYWHPEHMVPYLVKGDQWVGYDDEESFTVKLLYIKENNYGGAMIWNIDLDDFNSICTLSKRKYPLMSLMAEILGEYKPTTREPGTTETPQSTDTSRTTKQTEPPTTEGPTNPPGVFTCDGKTDGHYGNPFDCTKYHYCGHGIQYNYDCPPTLIWNQERLYCDHAYNVECRQQTGPPSTITTTQKLTTSPEVQTTEISTEMTTAKPITSGPTTFSITTETPTESSPTTTTTTSTTTTSTTTTTPTTTRKVTEPTTVTDPPSTDNFCANKENGLYKNTNDCQSYYQCAHTKTYPEYCQPGTLYHAELKVCDWADNVDCDEKDPDIEMCRDKSGPHPDPDNCSKYYNCAHGALGSSTLQTCGEGTYYSANLRLCDWIARVNCGDRPKPDDDIGERASICETEGDGLHLDPDNCHNYIRCAHGTEYLQTCGYLVFNPKIKNCDWPHNYDC